MAAYLAAYVYAQPAGTESNERACAGAIPAMEVSVERISAAIIARGVTNFAGERMVEIL